MAEVLDRLAAEVLRAGSGPGAEDEQAGGSSPGPERISFKGSLGKFAITIGV